METARLECGLCIRRRGPAMKSTSNNTNRVDALTDDLLFEILVRVGCSQSATRCKCVSKRWFRLISRPSFIAGFLSHIYSNNLELGSSSSEEKSSENQLPFSFLCDTVGSSGFTRSLFPWDSTFESHRGFSFDFLPDELSLYARVVGASYDLVILEVFGAPHSTIRSSERNVNFLVCNPRTMKWAWLPSIRKQSIDWSKVSFICKPYDPIDGQPTSTEDHYQYGYRVVCIHSHNNTVPLPIQIFSSKTQLWTQHVLSCPESKGSPILSNSVAYKGKLHWPTRENIVSFDPFHAPKLKGGVIDCRLISWPTANLYPTTVFLGVCLGVCNGYLRICLGQHPPSSFKVWELKDYDKGEWIFMHNICLSEFKVPKRPHWHGRTPIKNALSCIYVVRFHPYNGSIIFVEFQNFILSCNLQSKVLEVVPDIKMGGYPYLLMLPRWPTPVLSPSNYALL